MDYWHTIPAMADRATRETGKAVTPDDIFNLARRGVIRVGANIPEWKYAGNGELEWFYPDGSQAGVVITDGVACWLDGGQLGTLANRGEVSLSGTCWPVPDGTTLTAGSATQDIKRDDIRVPEEEYLRILAAINGEPSAPREIEGTAPTPPRVAAEPGAHLFQQWQERAARIYKLRKSEADLPPVEQESAIRLRDRYEQEQGQLEANPKFIAAVEGYIAHEQRVVEACKPGSNQGLVEQAKASIVAWSAHLARLRPTAMDSNGIENEVVPNTHRQKGEQAQEGSAGTDRATLMARHKELTAANCKNPTATLAKEFGISDSRVRAIKRGEQGKPRSGMAAMAKLLTAPKVHKMGK